MHTASTLKGAMVALAVAIAVAHQQAPPQPPPVSSTRPPENNEQGLRPLTPEEIPPNLNFYAMDPLYKAGTPLGWAANRIRETLDRGVVAMAAEGGGVHLSWRLLDTDPANVRFNVYRRSSAGEARLNATPIAATTDFVDRGATDPDSGWRVAAVVNGRERWCLGRRRLDGCSARPIQGHHAARRRAKRRPRGCRRSQRRRRV